MPWPAVKWGDQKEFLNYGVGMSIPQVVVLDRSRKVLRESARAEVELLPEDWNEDEERRAGEFDFDRYVKDYRERREKAGRPATREEGEKMGRYVEKGFEERIRRSHQLHKNSLKPETLGRRPSWEELLAKFHHARRTEAKKSVNRGQDDKQDKEAKES